MLLPLLTLPLLALTTAIPHHQPHLSNGCHRAPPAPLNTTTNLTITSSSITRSFLLHLPSTYTSSAVTPAVLSFHGNSRTASYQERLSRFSEASLNPDWIAVYPQGLSNSWEGPSYAVPGVDDLTFMDDLLDYLSENLCIDTSRIYAAGKSNGGGFVGTLACSEVGSRFAAFAPVSGAFYTDNPDTKDQCDARKKTPMMEFHGGNDTTIPYTGGVGKGGLLPDIDVWLGYWAERNGCGGGRMVVDEYGGDVEKTTFEGCDELVVGYKILDLPHAWPSLLPNEDNPDGTVVEATAVIMEWFAKWRLEGNGEWSDWSR